MVIPSSRALAWACVLALVVASGCSRAHPSGSAAPGAVAPGPTGSAGSDCVAILRRATSSTLGARSLTVDQSAWREHPAGSTVSGGGAAVITYQAPDRYHVVPTTTSNRGAPIEQVLIGRRWWQGSAATGWARYTTHQPTDPLRWLRVPARANRASWSGDACAFTATVPEGTIRGRAQVDARGHLLTLTMTLVSHGHTIEMAYDVSRVGSSPGIGTPPA
jgi:hypothetical protein